MDEGAEKEEARRELERLLRASSQRVREEVLSMLDDACGKKVDLGHVGLGDAGARAVGLVLSFTSSLQVLKLSNNSIGDEGARVIAEALKQNTLVTTLDLSNNSIGDEGARVIAEALKQNTLVTTLDLSNNSIGDEGARVIAEALKQNTLVTTLDLSNNSIGDEGGKAIAEALHRSTSVTFLDFKHNKIGDGGGKAFLSFLAASSTFRQLRCFSDMLKGSTSFAHLLATTHHKRPDVDVSFARWGPLIGFQERGCVNIFFLSLSPPPFFPTYLSSLLR